MNSKIIAVDFDGTLCENKFPDIGEANTKVINYLRNRKFGGAKLILWTCRVGAFLDAAVAWSKEQGLIFDAVNENLPEVLEWMGGDSRKIFADEYLDDKNIYIKDCKVKSTNELRVEKEVEIACKRERSFSGTDESEFDYGCACYESALKAYRSLLEDNHSGMSINFTKQILNRMIDGKPLSPIDDTDDIWYERGHRTNVDKKHFITYQCKRMSSLFKDVYDNGNIVYTDIDRVIVSNTASPTVYYKSGFIRNIIDEMFPISMPYIPYDEPFKVMREEFLFDESGGDYDTFHLLYVITPNGDKKIINRFFKDDKNTFIEISEEEYYERLLNAFKAPDIKKKG